MHKTLWLLTSCLGVVGIAFLFIRLPILDPDSVKLTIPIILWPKVLGIVIISAALGNLIFSYLGWGLINWIQLQLDPLSSFKASWALTITEIVLYSLALTADVKEFVAVWLAFKAVSVWTGHTGENKRSEWLGNDLQARSRYNLYLFNNAMRLGWGALTYVAVVLLI